jgi:hypothetical protein
MVVKLFYILYIQVNGFKMDCVAMLDCSLLLCTCSGVLAE